MSFDTRLQKILDANSIVLESNKDKYAAMFTWLDKFDDELNSDVYKDRASKEISRARQDLKKERVITWWLKHVRIALVKAIFGWIDMEDNPDTPELLAKKKTLNKMMSKYGSEFGSTDDVYYDGLDTLYTKLQHSISMANVVTGIDNYDYSGQELTPTLREFSELEDEWAESIGEGMVDTAEDDEVLIDLGDGWKWIDLKKYKCTREGGSMGHCGNTADGKPGQTILSLRKEKDVGSESRPRIMQRPSVTFIYNIADKTLGEMKGRANKKPNKIYHDSIIKLLTHKEDGEFFIKEVVGGGYAPSGNFALTDLSDEDKDALLKIRPEWRSISDIYRTDGFTEDVKEKLMKAHGNGLKFVDKDGEDFIHYQIADTMEELIELDSGNLTNLNNYLGYIQGDKILLTRDFDVEQDVNGYYADDILQPELSKIKKYIKKSYDYYDGTVEDFIKNEEDGVEFKNALRRSMAEGYSQGAEREMTAAYKYAVENLHVNFEVENGGGYLENDSIITDMYKTVAGYGYWGGAAYSVEMSLKELLRLMEAAGSEYEMYVFDNVSEAEEDMEVPYNGWSGFNEYSAKELFADLVHDIIN
tara:strand:- start:1820 stop:3580 length:1761 start_codon:yes stop_codon:yes gene_type:complete